MVATVVAIPNQNLSQKTLHLNFIVLKKCRGIEPLFRRRMSRRIMFFQRRRRTMMMMGYYFHIHQCFEFIINSFIFAPSPAVRLLLRCVAGNQFVPQIGIVRSIPNLRIPSCSLPPLLAIPPLHLIVVIIIILIAQPPFDRFLHRFQRPLGRIEFGRQYHQSPVRHESPGDDRAGDEDHAGGGERPSRDGDGGSSYVIEGGWFVIIIVVVANIVVALAFVHFNVVRIVVVIDRGRLRLRQLRWLRLFRPLG
mmetsp:Transcript_2207/g.4726  ORF Transcript_2207/g.4726 Transcript_2207/m.4726 type:complete len:251 (+) Transcript_2207:610-1362(+)